MSLSHFSICVQEEDFEKTLDFYLAALAPLGYKEMMRPIPKVVGLGADRGPEFWVAAKPDSNKKQNAHVAFTAPSHKVVDEFHAAAIKAGGECNGPPGPRPHYTPDYYAAFAYDPVGNNIEALTMAKE